MITLAQLEYVVAVDTYRHYVTAAEHVFVTQPTLSMQIKKLEQELGILIFDRSVQPVVPTEIGKKLIQQARIILKESSKINHLVADFQNQVSGSLKVGIIPTISPYLVPRFVGNLTRMYPDIQLHIRELKTHEIQTQLQKNLIDVGILVTPIKATNFIQKTLYYEELKLYVARNHELISNRKIHLSDLDFAEIWLMDEGHCFRNQTYNLCQAHSKKQPSLPFHYESGSLETLRQLVDNEGGITLLPELATMNLDTIRQSQIKRFSETTPLREVSLIHSPNFAKEKLLHLFETELKNAVPAQMLSAKRGTIVEWEKDHEKKN